MRRPVRGPAGRGSAGPAGRGSAGPAGRGSAGPVERGSAGPVERGSAVKMARPRCNGVVSGVVRTNVNRVGFAQDASVVRMALRASVTGTVADEPCNVNLWPAIPRRWQETLTRRGTRAHAYEVWRCVA